MTFIILMLTFLLQGEYIFYKIAKPYQLTREEHNTIYGKLIRYTFPANTNPINQYDAQEYQEMFRHEHAFLEKQLPSDIKVQFIPTILYELVVARLWTQFNLVLSHTSNKGEQYYSSIFKFPESRLFWKRVLVECTMENPVKKIFRDMNEVWLKDKKWRQQKREKKSYDLYNSMNIHEDIQAFHLLINNGILIFLHEHHIPIEQLQEEGRSIIDHLDTYFGAFERKLDLIFSGLDIESALSMGIVQKGLLEEVASLEWEHHAKGNFLLYRGTNRLHERGGKIDSTITRRENNLYPNSISYGNTLYAALFGDDCKEKGAMAYHYVKQADLSYVLLVNKYGYVTANVKNIFFIPPITTLVGLLAQGELFHTRTKGVIHQNDPKLCGIWFLSGTGPYYIPSFLMRADTCDWNVHEMQFSEYLLTHMHILHNKTDYAWDALQENQKQKIDLANFIYNKELDDFHELNFIVKPSC